MQVKLVEDYQTKDPKEKNANNVSSTPPPHERTAAQKTL